eukprot:671096-Pleurochrysis_carterae.AAC.1
MLIFAKASEIDRCKTHWALVIIACPRPWKTLIAAGGNGYSHVDAGLHGQVAGAGAGAKRPHLQGGFGSGCSAGGGGHARARFDPELGERSASAPQVSMQWDCKWGNCAYER